MKSKFKSPILLLLMLCGIFFSCNNNDEITTYDMICGLWTVTDIQFELTIEGQSFTTFLMNEYGLTEEEAQAVYEENKDSYRESWTGTMEYKSDGTYDFNVGGENYTNNWYLSDDKKTIHVFFVNYYMDLDILSITDNEMKLIFDQIFYSDIVGDNKKEAIAYSNHFTLEK